MKYQTGQRRQAAVFAIETSNGKHIRKASDGLPSNILRDTVEVEEGFGLGGILRRKQLIIRK
jgi:hypothetical protein